MDPTAKEAKQDFSHSDTPTRSQLNGHSPAPVAERVATLTASTSTEDPEIRQHSEKERLNAAELSVEEGASNPDQETVESASLQSGSHAGGGARAAERSISDGEAGDEEERAAWEREWKRVLEEAGQKVERAPLFQGKPLDLFRLYKEVTRRGGVDACTRSKSMTKVAEALGLPRGASFSAVAQRLKLAYLRHLFPLERASYPHRRLPVHPLLSPSKHSIPLSRPIAPLFPTPTCSVRLLLPWGSQLCIPHPLPHSPAGCGC